MPPPPPSEGKSSAVISGGVRAGRPEKGAPGGDRYDSVHSFTLVVACWWECVGLELVCESCLGGMGL